MSMAGKVLIVDDDGDIVNSLQSRFEWLGYQCQSASNGKDALRMIRENDPDIMLLDLEMPELGGIDVMKQLARDTTMDSSCRPAVVIMTAFGTVSRAVEAMKLGAQEFLTKPFDADHLSVVLRKIRERQALQGELTHRRLEDLRRYEMVIGTSERMSAVVGLAKQAAPSDTTVLLLGETGTGKEVLARSLHHWSPRARKPFMAINCAALPEQLLENELFGHEKGSFTGAIKRTIGKLEAAEGGTVFLDEIGDLPVGLQGRLLRVLQDREFHRIGGINQVRIDVRFIAATNRDLKAAVRAGSFREDLYYRLGVFPITLPPLRERRDDVPFLIDHFLKRFTKTGRGLGLSIDGQAVNALSEYAWPGNIRELENVLARAVILCQNSPIGPEHLGLQLTDVPLSESDSTELPYYAAMEHYSHLVLFNALKRAEWNQTKAAQLLGLQRTYFTKLLRQRNIPTTPSKQ
jgi:DNA-binding NtrC family response regulator